MPSRRAASKCDDSTVHRARPRGGARCAAYWGLSGLERRARALTLQGSDLSAFAPVNGVPNLVAVNIAPNAAAAAYRERVLVR